MFILRNWNISQNGCPSARNSDIFRSYVFDMDDALESGDRVT